MKIFYLQKNVRLLLLIAATFFIAGNSSAQTFALKETLSPNNTAATAMPVGTTPVKIRGNTAPLTDVDYYSFTATAGDKVYAALMTSFSSSTGNTQLTLYAMDGTTVLEFDEDNGSQGTNAPSIAGTTIPATGTYYLKVSELLATGTTRGYDLYLALKDGVPTPETEPNNDQATATPLPANGYITGSRSTTTDVDFYSVTLNAGETVFISMDLDPEKDGISYNGRLGIGVFGDAPNILVVDDAITGEVAPNYPSEAMFITVKDAGTYYIYADAASAAVGGPTATYSIAVTRFEAQTGYTTYPSTDIPKAIGPAPGIVTSVINIPDNVSIKDISVRINLTHALMADMDAILTNPAGNSIHLFSDIGSTTTAGPQITMDLLFNDNNAIPPLFTITKGLGYTPELNSKLEQFYHTSTAGNWTLTLYDDLANNAGTLNSWSIDILPETPISSGTILYSSDFESNNGGFTHTGTADEWAWGIPNTAATTTANPVAAFTTANSGIACWKTDLTGTYEINSIQTLISPVFDLSSATGITFINWAMKTQIESSVFDSLRVYVEEEGGTGMVQTLYEWLGATPTASVGNPLANIGITGGWGSWYADLSAFNGKQVRFKVRLGSDNTVNYAGVAIDDVKVFTVNLVPADETYLKGIKAQTSNKLQWKASCGSASSAVITLQRSSNGADFSDLYRENVTASRCEQPFDYEDVSPAAGKNYYRIKTVNSNGRITYGNVVLLLNQASGLQLMTVSPNPVNGPSFKLNATSAKAGSMQIVIKDALGKTISTQNSKLIAGYNTIHIISENLAAGVYYIYGLSEGERTQVISFIKK